MIFFQAALAEIDGLTRARVARADIEFGGVLRQRFIIDRIFAVAVGQGAVYIIQIDIVAGLEPVIQAGVFLAEHIIHIEGIIPPALSGQIGSQVCAARRNSDTVIKIHIVVEAPVKNARAIDIAKASAHVDHA